MRERHFTDLLPQKKELIEYLPEIFQPLLSGCKTMCVVCDDKGYKDRRAKLLEVLNVFHDTKIKIFPDKKCILRKAFVDAGADNTDAKEIVLDYQPEFYTAVEVAEILMLQKVPELWRC